MWISKAEFKEMQSRIVALEKQRGVVFWSVNFSGDYRSKFHAVTIYENVSGTEVPINELVCAIANHLGFTYKLQTCVGGIVPPTPDPLAQRGKVVEPI